MPTAHVSRSRRVAAFACVASMLAPAAWGADHDNLEGGLPTRLEDAYPIAYRGVELQGRVTYERTEDEEDAWQLEPRVEWGFARNWELSVGSEFIAGSDDDVGSGDIKVEALYNLNTEGLAMPAIAAKAGVEFPTGEDSERYEGFGTLILTKTPFARLPDRLHLNLSLHWKEDAADDEREARFVGILGWSRRLGPDTYLVVDVVREQAELKDDEWLTTPELGIRRQLTTRAVVSLGVSLGFTDPDGYDHVEATVAFQHSI